MPKRRRPAQHFRRVRTKKGIRRIIVNRGIKKKMQQLFDVKLEKSEVKKGGKIDLTFEARVPKSKKVPIEEGQFKFSFMKNKALKLTEDKDGRFEVFLHKTPDNPTPGPDSIQIEFAPGITRLDKLPDVKEDFRKQFKSNVKSFFKKTYGKDADKNLKLWLEENPKFKEIF